jgi:hypothetical protein
MIELMVREVSASDAARVASFTGQIPVYTFVFLWLAQA